MVMRRRDFIKNSALAGVALGLVPPVRMSRAERNERPVADRRDRL
jgi:hypothetical protein